MTDEAKSDDAIAEFEKILKFVFRESEEDERGGREFTCVNDRPTMRCLMMLSRKRNEKSGSSSVGRALAFQAKGRGFEPRLPLII